MNRIMCWLLLLRSTLLLIAADVPKPNIVFIMADDLGWADVGFHGGSAPTPNLDRLASESIELTQHYVNPVCSPTRSALLSGRYASRFGITNPQNQRAFPWGTMTLPRALKSAGYDTALIGKWHLGSHPDWGPQKFGFDHSYGSLAGGVGPWDHRYKQGPYSVTWHRHGQLVEEEGHVTDLLLRETIQWLETRTNRPFFLYVPFTAVHIPIREPAEYVNRVPKEITEPSLREYAACVMHLDDAVGRILDVLKKTQKHENTLLVFTSDNGGTRARNDDPLYPADAYVSGRSGGENRPFRAGKTTVYEGGTRVPTLVHWPGHLKPAKIDAPVHIADWMPTFSALAGWKSEKDLRWDGQNIWLLFSGAERPKPRTIYIAGPGFRSQSLRDGDWKLVIHRAAANKGNTTEKIELFDVAKDPNETTDMASSMPEKVAALQSMLKQIAAADRDAVAKD